MAPGARHSMCLNAWNSLNNCKQGTVEEGREGGGTAQGVSETAEIQKAGSLSDKCRGANTTPAGAVTAN